MKIDESTLPEGSRITTDSPYKITVTKGVLTKVSFGVKLPETKNEQRTTNNDEPLLKVSVSQDPVLLKPRLSISHKIITKDEKRTTNNESIEFTIECNYFLFIEKAKIDIYDSDMKPIKSIPLPKPLPSRYTLPTKELTNPRTKELTNSRTHESFDRAQDSPRAESRDELIYYQLLVFDKDGKSDRTGVGGFEL